MKHTHWHTAWRVRKAINDSPWYKAEVPGAADYDIASQSNLPDPFFADQARLWQEFEDCGFVYQSNFSRSEIMAVWNFKTFTSQDQIYWTSKGIDYAWTIYFNGTVMAQGAGMFRPIEIRIDQLLSDQNTLEVHIAPIPKVAGCSMDRSQAAASVKPAVSYGWDWHPRLVPSGLWTRCAFELRRLSFASLASFKPGLSLDNTQADFSFDISLDRVCANNQYLARLYSPEKQLVWEKTGPISATNLNLSGQIINPSLWWPHNQGTPARYQLELTIHDQQEHQTSQWMVGFRRIRLIPNQGAWQEPTDFPKGPSVPPIQLEINGRPIFIKGSNWVNPEIWPGRIGDQRYQQLIQLARDCNFNLLRVWGGGIINHEIFHSLCDELGILVWQEFPLACNAYPDSPDYLAVLEHESAAIVRRLALHPSTALWCGGNELFNSWSKMDMQSLALRLLDAQCLSLDPLVPFIPTSPIMGMGHGHYLFKDTQTGEEVFATMNRAHCTAYTEFGVPAPSGVKQLQTMIPAAELWPPRQSPSWKAHHAYDSWRKDTWLQQELIESYFGPSANLAELVEHGQILQAQGYRYIFEEARRQQPYCSMALNWCFNEPWPCAANNSLIMYPAEPKPAYLAVAEACRPQLISARYQKFTWLRGENFEAELFFLNDSPNDSPALKIEAWFEDSRSRCHVLTWNCPSGLALSNSQGPRLSYRIPEDVEKDFYLYLHVDTHPEMDSRYLFRIAQETRSVDLAEVPLNQTN